VSEEHAEFEALFRDTRSPLLAYLTRRAPAEDAADLLAEVYLVAWRRRDALPRGEERRLWLFGVARRLLADHHRSAGRRLDAAGGAPCPVPDGATCDDRRGESVRQVLATLGDLDRELVTLTTWEGMTPAEAARVVGITAGTARVRLHRARARLARHPRLRALLDEVEDGHAGPSAAPPPPGRPTLVLAPEL
jgi:RNA polymerase sigma-70 factor (ECF subfamily)